MIPVARPQVGSEELAAVGTVFESGILSNGPKTEAFEARFAEWIGVREAVAVNSGTSALVVAIMAAGLSRGAEVIVPSFTFAATANAVRLAGATPVFADVELTTYALSPDSVMAAITPKTEGIMPVHLYGHPADMTRLGGIASKHGLALFEDAAQAHGAMVGDTKVGALSDAGAFSFYPTKNMTTGEGGIVTTDDPALARKARLLRNQGMAERYVHKDVGMNVRMSEIAAAIGLVQMEKINGWNEARAHIAGQYGKAIEGAVTPTVTKGYKHVFNQYTLRTGDRQRLIEVLTKREVGYAIYYPVPTHRQAPYVSGNDDLPATDRASAEVLSIPMRPDLTESEIDAVITAVNEASL